MVAVAGPAAHLGRGSIQERNNCVVSQAAAFDAKIINDVAQAHFHGNCRRVYNTYSGGSRAVCRLRHSKKTPPPATLTFNDATPPVDPPAMGIETRKSQWRATV